MAESADSARKQLAYQLQHDHNFQFCAPTQQDAITLARAITEEHNKSPRAFALTESFAGFRTVDAVVAWIHHARRRQELWVLARHDDGGMSCPLLLGDKRTGRWLVPAFVTAMVTATADPYIELMWVRSDVRRLGIGSRLVRDICMRRPCITHARGCLPEADGFWNAVGENDARDATSCLLKHKCRTSHTGGE